MGFGTRPPRPTTRLNYHALDTALHDLAKSGKRDKTVLQLQNCAQAYRKDDAIVLKLYRTEIITFHVNGSATIDCHGWVDRVTTRNWLRCAGHYVYAQKLNQWDSSVYLYHQMWVGSWDGRANDGDVLYYDGIVIGKDGQVTSERKPIVKRVPNEEARALLRKWRAVVKKQYLPHIRMEEGSNRPLGGHYGLGTYDAIEILEEGEFSYEMMQTSFTKGAPTLRQAMDRYVKSVWEVEVDRRKLLDEVPYQPPKEK